MNLILLTIYKKYIEKVVIQENGYLVLNVNHQQYELDSLFLTLKKSYLFLYSMFVDLVGLNNINNIQYKFNLFYNFLSYSYNNRLLLKKKLQMEYDNVKSLSVFYKSANWLEREVWDLFGIFFFNHIDLRRILTDYGFKGFPLRKDFPLTGFYEVRYDDFTKVIVYELVKLTQEYRNFYFSNPWN